MPSRFDLADRDHGVALAAVDRVAVDVERVGEAVVRRGSAAAARNVGGTTAGSSSRTFSMVLRSGLIAFAAWCVGLRLVLARPCTLSSPNAVRVDVDVALDVRRLLARLVRAHLELLHERRVDAADQRRPTSTSRPNATPGSAQVRRNAFAKNSTATDQRDHQQDVLGRQHRVDVAVLQARDQALVAHREREPVEPVRDRLEQHEDAEQHRDVRAGRRVTLSPGVCRRMPPYR